MSTESAILHATTVSVEGRGAVIIGPSGAGKSALALDMMSRGAELVADDRTEIYATGQVSVLMARAPTGLPSLIEARGVGLLNAQLVGPVEVHLVVDLGKTETQRLPEFRSIDLLGLSVPLLHRAETTCFAASLKHYLLFGRRD